MPTHFADHTVEQWERWIEEFRHTQRRPKEETVTLLNEALREGGALHRDPIVKALAESIESHAKVLATTLYMEDGPGQKVYTVTACIEMLESELRHLRDRYDIVHAQAELTNRPYPPPEEKR